MTDICATGEYTGWKDIFDCTDPNSWASTGIIFCMGFSILGAGL